MVGLASKQGSGEGSHALSANNTGSLDVGWCLGRIGAIVDTVKGRASSASHYQKQREADRMHGIQREHESARARAKKVTVGGLSQSQLEDSPSHQR